MSNLFTKAINDRQFNFQPFEFGEQAGYHVDVKDEDGTRWEFRMLRDNDRWKMEAEKMPTWILNAEPEIVNAIDEHD
ncbi:MAG: hypothetical protein ABJA71_05385 [Ginsengibacter sp.]